MFKRFDSFLSRRGITKRIIKTSFDLYPELSPMQIRETEIEKLLTKFKKTGIYEQEKANQAFDGFIRTVSDVIKKLETEKRRIEAEEYKKLQELKLLVSSEGNVVISRKMKEIEAGLFSEVMQQEAQTSIREMRVAANAQPRGYYLKKMVGERSLLRDVLRHSADEAKKDSAGELSRLISIFAQYGDKVSIYHVETQLLDVLTRYQKSFRDNFEVTVDIEIEEARLLHNISRYREYARLLKLEQYVKLLDELKARADGFVRQDAVDTKQLRKMAFNLHELTAQLHFAENARQTVFSDVEAAHYSLGIIGATLYFNKLKRNGKGVLVASAIFSSREQFSLLSRRIASEGYDVLTIDMPSQGESLGEWKLGIMSEFIFNGIYALRQARHVEKVAVIGLSLGSVAALLAAMSYNHGLENRIYSLFERYTQLILELPKYEKLLASPEKFTEPIQELDKIRDELSATYAELKQLILDSIRSGRFNFGRIDAFVLLSPITSFKDVIPPGLIYLLAKMKHEHVKWVVNNFINKPLKLPILKPKFPVPYSGPAKNADYAELYFLKVPEVREFVNYVATMESPFDYIKLLTQLEKRSEFIRAFLDRTIRQPPKIFIYGEWDLNLKFAFLQKRKKELDATFSIFGNHRSVAIPGIGHPLVSGTKFGVGRGQVAEDSRVVKEILSFLHANI